MHKETITTTLDVPDGYELTGEFRRPDGKEWFIHYDGLAGTSKAMDDGSGGYSRFILRKAWTPPAWMPEGYWLYKAADGWYISKVEPEKLGDHFAVSSKKGGSLCKLTYTGGGAVNSRTPNKIQIKHAKT